jgi:hypothetical protein
MRCCQLASQQRSLWHAAIATNATWPATATASATSVATGGLPAELELRDSEQQCMQRVAAGRWTARKRCNGSIPSFERLDHLRPMARGNHRQKSVLAWLAGRWWQALFAATAGRSLEPAGRRPWVLAAKLTVVPPFHACATGRPASSEAGDLGNVRT